MLEGPYKTRLTKKIRKRMPHAIVLRLDANHLQGVPDILILLGPCWGALEGKASPSSPVQPNQPYYVHLMNEMSFAAFIDPSNEEEVLRDLQQALERGWASRFSEPQ